MVHIQQANPAQLLQPVSEHLPVITALNIPPVSRCWAEHHLPACKHPTCLTINPSVLQPAHHSLLCCCTVQLFPGQAMVLYWKRRIASLFKSRERGISACAQQCAPEPMRWLGHHLALTGYAVNAAVESWPGHLGESWWLLWSPHHETQGWFVVTCTKHPDFFLGNKPVYLGKITFVLELICKFSGL